LFGITEEGGLKNQENKIKWLIIKSHIAKTNTNETHIRDCEKCVTPKISVRYT
jgi:hypothetical protein